MSLAILEPKRVEGGGVSKVPPDWFRYQVAAGTAVHGGRSEQTYGYSVKPGQTQAFGLSLYFPPDFKSSSSWDYLLQLHKDGDMGGWGGPPVGVYIADSGNLLVIRVRGPKQGAKRVDIPLGHFAPGERVDVAFDCHFSSKSDGWIDPWFNGEQLERNNGSTLFDDGSGAFLKSGYYLGSTSGSDVIFSGNPRVGSLDEVVASFARQTLKPGSSQTGTPYGNGDPGPVDPPPVDPPPVDPPPVDPPPDPDPVPEPSELDALKAKVACLGKNANDAKAALNDDTIRNAAKVSRALKALNRPC
jgi:hypothetical protein